MTIHVVSKRSGGTKPVAGELVVNIARPSVLGNPFVMRHEGERAVVVSKYRDWLIQQYPINSNVRDELHRIAGMVKEGKSIALECWCAPCRCHGDVLIEAVEWLNKQ